jgi:hypothetical protein
VVEGEGVEEEVIVVVEVVIMVVEVVSAVEESSVVVSVVVVVEISVSEVEVGEATQLRVQTLSRFSGALNGPVRLGVIYWY